MIISSIKDNSVIFNDFRYGNLYLVDFSCNNSSLSIYLFTKSSKGWLYYRRLSHIGMNQLNHLLKHDLVVGLKDVKFKKNKLCSACQVGK